eukprot:SAG31_NODE_5205_length_2677_cov_4.130334_2_plen_302_part_00
MEAYGLFHLFAVDMQAWAFAGIVLITLVKTIDCGSDWKTCTKGWCIGRTLFTQPELWPAERSACLPENHCYEECTWQAVMDDVAHHSDNALQPSHYITIVALLFSAPYVLAVLFFWKKGALLVRVSDGLYVNTALDFLASRVYTGYSRFAAVVCLVLGLFEPLTDTDHTGLSRKDPVQYCLLVIVALKELVPMVLHSSEAIFDFTTCPSSSGWRLGWRDILLQTPLLQFQQSVAVAVVTGSAEHAAEVVPGFCGSLATDGSSTDDTHQLLAPVRRLPLRLKTTAATATVSSTAPSSLSKKD